MKNPGKLLIGNFPRYRKFIAHYSDTIEVYSPTTRREPLLQSVTMIHFHAD